MSYHGDSARLAHAAAAGDSKGIDAVLDGAERAGGREAALITVSQRELNAPTPLFVAAKCAASRSASCCGTPCQQSWPRLRHGAFLRQTKTTLERSTQ